MLILFKSCQLFTPEPAGKKDVLTAGSRIIAIEESISEPVGLPVTTVETGGLIMVPGLIDNHVHIAGAGGEGGPSTRTTDLRMTQLLKGGITSVIGCLGTDGLTRTVESVLMKAKALREEGVSAWILTGAYQVPPPTILGDVGKDIALIDEIIGVGEIAVSDHRSSFPTAEELIRLAEHARVGGMLGGKAGIVNLHMGDAENPFSLLHDVVKQSELKYTQFLPTHCNRNDYIFRDAKSYGREGYVDITTSSYPFFPEYEVKPSKTIRELTDAGVPIEHITFSSDGCGSLPHFDDKGNLVKLVSGEPESLLTEIRDAVIEEKIPLEMALKVATTNPADIFKLKGKGRLQAGHDADMVVMDDSMSIVHLVAKGVFMIRDREVVRKGLFES